MKKSILITICALLPIMAAADWQVSDPVSPTFTAPVGTPCGDVIYSNAGIDYRSVTVNGFAAPFQCEQTALPPPPPSSGGRTGLQWFGDANVTHIRAMLRFRDAFPAFPATIIMDMLPHKKTNHHAYFTGFFWERVSNDQGVGLFNGNQVYYGAHPYPVPAPSGAGRWEVAADGDDATWKQEVQWDRWHTIAITAKANGAGAVGNSADVTLYFDLPDTTKAVNNHHYIRSSFATGHLVIGQSPSDPDAPTQSWGGYDGWEDFNGAIRRVQIYTAALTTDEILKEIAQPMSTPTGRASIWYLNLNPTPSDVTDKKGIGVPHDPIWIGGAAAQWP